MTTLGLSQTVHNCPRPSMIFSRTTVVLQSAWEFSQCDWGISEHYLFNIWSVLLLLMNTDIPSWTEQWKWWGHRDTATESWTQTANLQTLKQGPWHGQHQTRKCQVRKCQIRKWKVLQTEVKKCFRKTHLTKHHMQIKHYKPSLSLCAFQKFTSDFISGLHYARGKKGWTILNASCIFLLVL